MSLLSFQKNKSDDTLKSTLHGLVSSADSIQQLVPILQTLSLNNLKQYIHQQIDALSSCKYSYFNACAIDDIFNEDVMQYILSFAGIYNTKAVSKSWKLYSEKNEAQQILKINAYLNSKTPTEFQYDAQKNKSWIIHPHRKTLHPKEKELNYNKPIPDINKAITRHKSGDRILIYNGTYSLTPNRHKWGVRCEITRDVILMGVGDNVIINQGEPDVNIWLYASMYVGNITFDHIGIWNEAYEKGDTLWMNNVRMKSYKTVGLYQGGKDAFVKDCTFDGMYIQMYTSSKNTVIESCKFENNRNENGCIELKMSTCHSKYSKLTCVGNIFTNIKGYPMCLVRDQRYDNVLEADQYEFKNNILENVMKQDALFDVKNIDSNKLYTV